MFLNNSDCLSYQSIYITWQYVAHNVGHAPLLDLLDDGPVPLVGEEPAPHHLEAEGRGAGHAVPGGLFEDHVANQLRPVHRGLPRYWKLKIKKNKKSRKLEKKYTNRQFTIIFKSIVDH